MQSHRRFRLSAFVHLFLAACFLLSLGIASAVAQEANTPDSTTVPSRTFQKEYVTPVPLIPPEGNSEIAKVRVVVDRRGAGEPAYCYSTGAKMTRKLWRGFNNVLFGWVEIPKTVMVDVVDLDPFTGFFCGVTMGTAKAIERTGIGTVEIVTFWHQWPQEFTPIILPEFVLGDFVD